MPDPQSLPATMRALQFSVYGAPGTALDLVDLPVPPPADGEALVRVEAAAINPSDVKNVAGLMAAHTVLPRVPRRDFAGTVVAGPDEWVGKSVWGTGGDLGFTRDGTHAPYVLLPVDALVERPANLPATEAAAAGVGFVTAWTGLVDQAALTTGDTLLVVGAGAVGIAAAQIARWKGAARVLATARSTEDAARRAGTPGVDGWIDLSPRRPPIDEQVRAANGGKGVSVVLNTVGGALFAPGLAALAPGGRMIVIAASGDPHVGFDLLDFYRRELRLFGVNTLTQTATDSARRLRAMADGFATGALTLPPVETRPLHQAPYAYDEVSAGSKAKIVLIPEH